MTDSSVFGYRWRRIGLPWIGAPGPILGNRARRPLMVQAARQSWSEPTSLE